MYRGSLSTPIKGGPSVSTSRISAGSSVLLDGETSSASLPTSPSTGSSVQVVIRLRPINEQEKKHGTLPVVTASTADKTVTVIKGQGPRQVKSSFVFDNVFTAFSTQEEVFDGTLKPVISDIMKGFESTVFAYGQTGTGKTWTIEGDLKNPEQQGVIPRAAHAIFDKLKQSQYKDPMVTCSYLEIYNEDLCDLLVDIDERSVGRNMGADNTKRSAPKLEIMESKTGTFCRGLSEKEVTSALDVLQLMQKAQQQRHIGETKMNKQSSRSHCIFTIRVHANLVLPDGGGTMEFNGKLHMVDLAGSECARTASLDKPSSADAARERERMNINRSLLTLGRVISMLKESSESKRSNIRIPYRDSKLTRILQESLGGRCKTVIIATLSPSITAIEESISTLNYAQSALGIVNKPVSTSFLSLNPGQTMSVRCGENGSDGDSNPANAVEYWHEMECRLQYMQAQVEEAQAALARKHLQQQELLERAEKAHAERLEVETKLNEANQEITTLSASLADEIAKRRKTESTLEVTQNELQKTVLILDATRETERRLTTEAKALLSTLQTSICDGDALYSMLKQKYESEVSTRGATKDFHSASNALLADTLVLLRHLSSGLENHCRSVSATASEMGKQEQKSTSALTRLLSDITEHVSSMAHAMTDQVNGQEGLNSVASEVSSKVRNCIQTTSSAIAEGEAALLSSLSLSRTRLEQSSEQLKALGCSHEILHDERLSSFEAVVHELKRKLDVVMSTTARAIKQAETVRSATTAAHKSLLSEWKKEIVNSCNAISSNAEHHSGAVKDALKTFSDEMEHHARTQKALNDQRQILADDGNAHISKVSQQASLIVSNETFLQEAYAKQFNLRDACVRNIMNRVHEIVDMEMNQLSHATEEQFELLKRNSTAMKEANASIANSAQTILAAAGDANSCVAQQVEALQKNDSAMLQVMEQTDEALEHIIQRSKSHHESANRFSSQVKQGLDKLADLDIAAIKDLRTLNAEVQSSSAFVENSLHAETVDAMRVLRTSGGDIVRLTDDSVILPMLGAIDEIIEPRKMILEHVECGEREVTEFLNEQLGSFTRISEQHKAIGDNTVNRVTSMTADYQTNVAKENSVKIESMKQDLLKSVSVLSGGQSKLLASVSSKTEDVKSQIEGFSSNTMKMNEGVPSVPNRQTYGFSQVLSFTPNCEEIISKMPLVNQLNSSDCNIELEPDSIDAVTIDEANMSKNQENGGSAMAEKTPRDENSDTISLRSGETADSGRPSISPPFVTLQANTSADTLLSKREEFRVPKDAPTTKQRFAGRKRPILGRVENSNNGTPSKGGRKKAKFVSTPTRSTPNAKLK